MIDLVVYNPDGQEVESLKVDESVPAGSCSDRKGQETLV